MKVTSLSMPRSKAEPKEPLAAPGTTRMNFLGANSKEYCQPIRLGVVVRSLGLGNPFARLEASGRTTCGDGSVAHTQASHYALSRCWGTSVGRAPRQRSLVLRYVERGCVSV
jgi:hypothetical protein